MASTTVQSAVPNEQVEKSVSADVSSTVAAAMEERLSPPKPYELGPFKIPNYYSATSQVLIAGFVNFLAVGMSG